MEKLLVFLSMLIWMLVVMTSPCNGADIPKIRAVRFLVTVNDTWSDPPCIATVATSEIQPNLTVRRSPNVIVGECDHGALQYVIHSPGLNNNNYTVSLIFHSSVIEDASPPTCDLSWNGTYIPPKSSWQQNPDPLPSCVTGDSREGYHMTYYWFHILEWFYD